MRAGIRGLLDPWKIKDLGGYWYYLDAGIYLLKNIKQYTYKKPENHKECNFEMRYVEDIMPYIPS